MTARITPDGERLLDARNFAHLSTLMPDGAPKVEPVWVMREGPQVLVTSDRKSLKVLNVEADPRVALSVVDFDNPYEELLIRGTVVEIRPDPEMAVLDAMSLKYLGVPFARRRWSDRVVLVIEPSLARHYRSALRDPRSAPAED
jgi:PPOX class probable F420-dependent enzyme